jgi:hypothetical protein
LVKFQRLFAALNKGKVRYLVAGGIAVNLYGIERATGDIDIIVDLEEDNIRRFIKVLKELGFKPKVPVRLDDLADARKRENWARDKGMEVFSLFDPKNTFFLVDVFVEAPFDFKKVFEKRERMRAGRTVIPVVPLEGLIRMKEKSGRPQDKADAFYLKKIRKGWRDEG